MRICVISGCDRPATVRLDVGGYCRNHYIRERERGRIPLRPRPTAEERFRSYYVTDKTTDCHMWTGTVDRKGYALFWADGKTVRAARWIYEREVGEVPDGRQLDHFRCDRPGCVNPQHVRPVTPRENVLRANSIQAWNLAKEACPRGHLYDTGNTHYRPDGSRRCRQCSRPTASD